MDHISVDLDILISSKVIYKAARLLREKIRILVYEPYTITLAKKSFIVDLYTQPSIAWIIYSDGEKLLKEYSEEIMIDNAVARALSIEVETAVSAAHAIYKEHMVLLIDCLTIWRLDKIFRGPLFRSTLLNILKYLVKRENIRTIIINRIKRKSY